MVTDETIAVEGSCHAGGDDRNPLSLTSRQSTRKEYVRHRMYVAEVQEDPDASKVLYDGKNNAGVETGEAEAKGLLQKAI